ncbi:odorant receptor 67b isoform X1 [Aethina tumida]|uniref:odorant receptor 67b isoform X1 n=1 Tax=Aethina tumida TaxID=116153 RepID=UPI00096B32DD|nr:odorant receptor 67b isoform X1 [Aethina tumida]
MVYVYVPEILGRYFFLVLENVLIPLITLTVVSFDYLILTFMQLTIIQFQILHSEISKLYFGQDQHQSNLRSQFTKIIKHHIFLLEFADKLKQIISLPFLFQYFTTVMAICMELYVSRKNFDLGYIILAMFYVVAILFQITLYCKSCQDVMDLSADVSNQIYTTKWYESQDNSLKMSIKFMIMRSDRSIAFSGSGFVPINLEALVMVFKTIMSFNSFLTAMDT